uniref:Secreted protein n=1 Tax=Plectus sambesii TaxID=2011161 RepID=A0A914X5L7_9BILA
MRRSVRRLVLTRWLPTLIPCSPSLTWSNTQLFVIGCVTQWRNQWRVCAPICSKGLSILCPKDACTALSESDISNLSSFESAENLSEANCAADIRLLARNAAV